MSNAHSQRHINHDLRTPMNHIIGYSELLMEEAEDLKLVEAVGLLKQVRATGKHLLTRLNEVFINKSLPPHVPLNDAREELIRIVEDVNLLTGRLFGKVPEDMDADLKKIDAAASQFAVLVRRFSEPPTAETPSESLLVPRVEPMLHVFRPGRLLVVDDIPDNRDVLSQLLQRQGHTIGLAEHGGQALDMLAKAPYDLVLLDLMMPVMNGMETLNRLKASEKLRHIPVIIVSAIDEIQSVVRAIEQGAEDYLTKPFDPTLLRARINASLERKQLRDAELLYLEHVSLLTFAARAVEAETFEPDTLVEVTARQDPLGNLARVFTRMAHEIYAREIELRDQAQKIQIAIDTESTERRVVEITSSEFFNRLKQNTRRLPNEQR